jgi:hypothetical protein
VTQAFFKTQMVRLQTRFTAKAFDSEFVALIWREVHDMSESGFQRFCDVMIGSRTAHKPPLLSEFREARINERKLKFENDVRGAAQSLKRAPEEMRRHMRAILSKEFGGVESVGDALEIAQLRRRLTTNEPDGGGTCA